jgi:hypothetical protein
VKTSHRRAVLALALAVAAGVSGSAPAQADAQIAEVGWWKSVAVSQPPEGGVAVASNPSGPSAVAAFRVTSEGDPPTTAELTLLEAGTVNGETAPLQICPTADEWTAEAGGTMDKAPTPDCEAGSVVVARDDAGAWTADVATLLTAPTVSLMLVPGDTEANADPLAGAAFELAFEAPTLTASAPVASGSYESTSSSYEGSGEPVSSSAPSSAGSSSSASFSAPPSDSGTSSFSATPIDQGEAGLAAPPPPAGQQAAAPPSDQTAVAPVSPVPTRAATDGGGGGSKQWGQAISYALMAAAIGAVAGLGRWQLRARGILAT